MTNETEKLKNAFNYFQQAKWDEEERIRRAELERQARIEREQQEEQRRIEMARLERKEMQKRFCRLAVFVGIIAGIFFGWVYILDFVGSVK